MRALYCTGDVITPSTGGGLVCLNEIEVLKTLFDDVVVIGGDQINPAQYSQPDSVFLMDYFALELVRNMPRFDHANFYSWTFSHTVRWLKDQGTKVTYTVPAHDRRLTVEEFEIMGMAYPYAHIKDDNLWHIFSQGYREADLVIVPSERSAGFLRNEGCKNIVVIPHGCYIPEGIEPLPGKFTAGYLGQVGPDKGIYYLLKAWEMLNYKSNTLLLAGSGTELLGNFISRTVNGGIFNMLGRVPEARQLYDAVSVYVQPSVTESFGIEVLEAMAHSRPVIASEGAGASELITEGLEGFVVPIRDPKALADRISFLKNNPNKIATMGKKAREKALNYSWEAIRGKYKEVL